MKFRTLRRAAAAGAAMLAAATPAQAQTLPRYLGEIFAVANAYCPASTLEANGQVLYLAQNTMLYSLYGDTFGGNGSTTFALPDLRGRSAVNQGQGYSPYFPLPRYAVGDALGSEAPITITDSTMAAHAHGTKPMRYVDGDGNTDDPTNASLTDLPPGVVPFVSNGPAPNPPPMPLVDMMAGTVATLPVGQSKPFTVHSPFLTLRYCVVVNGLFPSRP